MKKTRFYIFVFCWLLLISSCVLPQDNAETAKTVSVGESLSGSVVPVPCDTNGITWKGSAVDLMVADAIATCSGNPAWKPVDPVADQFLGEGGGLIRDSYLIYVRSRMLETIGSSGTGFGTIVRWVMLRSDPTKNCDPSTMASNSPVSIKPAKVPGVVIPDINGLGYDQARYRAENELRLPGFSLCLAQSLRGMVPGASGGESLLMSDADQRMLLEIVREYSQVAMLSYAQLGTLWSRGYEAPTDPQFTATLPFIQWWAVTDGKQIGPGKHSTFPEMQKMGTDFAAAVQLHVIVSEELASLLARSSSARTARGGSAKTRTEEIWGSGSFHQRLLAAMLGGDPLANDLNGPWMRPDPKVMPPDVDWGESANQPSPAFNIPGPPTAAGKATGWDWPSDKLAPYVKTNISEPQVHELLGLARRFDRLALSVRMEEGEFQWSCTGVDLERSADFLYRWVEADLRCLHCSEKNAQGTCPTDCTYVQQPTALFPTEKYQLWERYRIHPDHAKTLVKYLADNMVLQGGQISGGWLNCQVPDNGSPNARGAQVPTGRIEFSADESSADYRLWMHLLPSDLTPEARAAVGFSDRSLADIAPTYARNAVARFPAPWEIQPLAPASAQGFTGICEPNATSDPACLEPTIDAKRLMGATSALALTRFLITTSLGNLSLGALPWESARVFDFFAQADQILATIDGAIGPESVALAPLQSITDQGSYQWKTEVKKDAASKEPLWYVSVTYPNSDSGGFWEESGVNYQICAISNPVVANLAQGLTKYGETTLASLATSAATEGRCATGVFWSESAPQFNALQEIYPGAPHGLTALNLRLPLGEQSFSLIAVGVKGQTKRYKLLGSNFAIPDTSYLLQGQYISTGGVLGGIVQRSLLGRRNNPAEPAFDGFGLATDWVPPFTAELIGGSAEQASSERYLALAKSAAEEATSAVNTAIASLAAEQSDEHAMISAAEKWQKGLAEEKTKLCGSSAECNIPAPKLVAISSLGLKYLRTELFPCTETENNCEQTYTDCGTAATTYCDNCGLRCKSDCLEHCSLPLSSDWTSMSDAEKACFTGCQTGCLTACENETADDKASCHHNKQASCDTGKINCQQSVANSGLECALASFINPVVQSQIPVAQPVLDRINDPQVPAFMEFSGGSLQSALIAQWTAIHALDDRAMVLLFAAEAAKGRTSAAYQALLSATTIAANQCDPNRQIAAFKAGKSGGCAGSVESSNDGHTFRCVGHSNSVQFSTGPSFAQQVACSDASAGLPAPQQAAISSCADGLFAVASASSGLVDAQGRIAETGTQIAKLISDSALAKSRLSLEQKLSAQTLQTSFGMYRRFRSYDAWRAKALIENARRYALAARRAIEARYVVNLSVLTQPESFVQSPTTWADEVYAYDLSLPAAVGLSSGTGAAKAGAAYPNKVRDYVNNLEGFVMGYAASRPSAVAKDDIDVLNLNGLRTTSTSSSSPNVGVWQLRCRLQDGSTVWIPAPTTSSPNDVCVSVEGSSHPDRAKLEFLLDPWGRLSGSIANEPYARRYNGRWGLMAVNFVGSGMKDCDKASDPYACYNEAFVRYQISHVGPAWITDFDGIWRTSGVPIGRVEGAKGLAAELWLDPLKYGWSSPHISAVSRSEFMFRPLGGAYEIEFEVQPEVNLDKIERVQVLVGSSYWVKQN